MSTLKTTIMCRVVDACIGGQAGSSRCSGIGELAEEASSWVATGADMTLVLLLCLLVCVGAGCTGQLQPGYCSTSLLLETYEVVQSHLGRRPAAFSDLSRQEFDWSSCHSASESRVGIGSL